MGLHVLKNKPRRTMPQGWIEAFGKGVGVRGIVLKHGASVCMHSYGDVSLFIEAESHLIIYIWMLLDTKCTLGSTVHNRPDYQHPRDTSVQQTD